MAIGPLITGGLPSFAEGIRYIFTLGLGPSEAAPPDEELICGALDYDVALGGVLDMERCEAGPVVTAAANAVLWEDGTAILWDDGEYMTWEEED